MNEGGVDEMWVALRSAPGDAVTVTLTSSDPARLTIEPATLTLEPANAIQGQPVRLKGLEDVDGDIDDVWVTATAPGFDPVQVDVSVYDKDPQMAVVSTPRLQIAEEASQAFDVRLAFQPSADRTVRVTSANVDVAAVKTASTRGTTPAATGTLTFTPANWSTPQVVTVTGRKPKPLAEGETDADMDPSSESTTLKIDFHRAATVKIPVKVTSGS